MQSQPSLDEPPSQWLLSDLLQAEFNYFYLFSFVAIGVLLFLSAMISASEVAFFSLKTDALDHCRESENESERNIATLLKKPRLLLATILIMNNFVNVAVVTIATFLMWDMTGTRKPAETIVGLVTFGATFAITFFGEIIPKVYAAQHNMTFARKMGRIWLWLETLWRPVSWALMNLSHIVEKRIEKKGYSTTVEELNQALELTTQNDNSTEGEKEILKGIVNFGTLTVKQVMKSRVDMSSVDIALNFSELMEQVNKSGFSRIPVYKESLDRIEGILYVKDLLPFLEEKGNFNWQKLLRPVYFVPESKKLDSLLKDFQSKRVHMAIVADEYGGTAGLITLEDLIEEIIGEINDEFDEVVAGYQKIDDHTYTFEGKTSIHDLCKVLDMPPDYFDGVKGENESLGGLILEQLNSLPKNGDEVTFRQFNFAVVSVDNRRIKKVKVIVKENTPHEE